MSYLAQILQNAQANGMSEQDFVMLFGNYMNQQQQPQQPSLGLPQQPVQAPQMIPLAKADNSMGMYGKEMASLGKALGKKFKSTPEEDAIKKAEEEARKAKLLDGLGIGGIGESMKGLFDFI